MKFWTGFLLRLILAGVLGVAGYIKAVNPNQSKMAVRAYEILPTPFANLLGQFLPWLEIGAALLLLLGVAVRYAAIFAAALMLLFMVAISMAWMKGLSIDCGCFGGGGQINGKSTQYLPEILRDLALALVALYLVRYPRTPLAIEKISSENENFVKREG